MPNTNDAKPPFVEIKLRTGGPHQARHNTDARIPEGRSGSQHYAILSMTINVYSPATFLPVAPEVELIFALNKRDQHVRLSAKVQHQKKNAPLLTRCAESSLTYAAAEGQLIRHLKSLGARRGRLFMCGFNAFESRSFIAHQLPKLSTFLGNKCLDLTTTCELLSLDPAPNQAVTDILRRVA